MPNVSLSAAAEEQGESRCVAFFLGVLSYRLFLASSNSTLDAVWKRDGFPLHTARLLAAAGTPNSLDLAPLIFRAIRTVRHTPATELFRAGAAVLLGSLSVRENLYVRGLCSTLRLGPSEHSSTSQLERRMVQRESCLEYSALSAHACMLACLWKESGLFLRDRVCFHFHSRGIPGSPAHERKTTLSAKLKARSGHCIHSAGPAGSISQQASLKAVATR